ncbi:MAG: aminotransferase class I/II-fold pyridoxal phosphate-dependent enzyme [Candidatus Omnitrophica bacterium]|nr:aminotransferase class I/II-fold pyridoxal phosphate-dependent enzyme [Candidatus Omnitrophota bacterium]
MQISKCVQELAPSGIRAFFDLVLGMKDVISLGVGEPDFVTPWHVREKAISSLEQGSTSYTSNKGMPELRKAIAEHLKKKYKLDYDYEEQILITVGVSEGLDLVMRAVLNPGDKVIIPEPYYVAYTAVVHLAGAIPVTIPTTIKTGFKITPKDIEKAYTKSVKAILLGYPSNPSGISYTKKELLALAAVAKKLDILVITDEVYDELTYDYPHTPMATLPGMQDRIVYLNGFSKVYAMTGFRIGWACGPAEVIAAMTKIHQYTMLCASITGQIAAREAILNGAKETINMKQEYDRRRNFIVQNLNEIGLTCHMPEGAFYAFPSIKISGESSMDFAKNLLSEQKVALVPGVAFGQSCEGYVRISYASSYENLKEAIARMKIYLENSKKRGKG